MTWFYHAIHYTLPTNDTVQLLRILVCLAAGFLIGFSLFAIRLIGFPRCLIYMLVGLISVAQELEQYHYHARFRVWRLPSFTLLIAACLWSVTRYLRGKQR